MMALVSAWKRLEISSTTIDARIVFPAPGIPGQNSVCLLVPIQLLNSAESKPLPCSGLALLEKVVLLRRVVDRSQPVKDRLLFMIYCPLFLAFLISHQFDCVVSCLA